MYQEDSYFKEILDNMLEGCQIIGFDWQYLYLNEVAAQHARLQKTDVLGRRMMEVYPGIEETPMFAALARCMETREAQKMENEFVYPDGSSAWFDLHIQPVAEGILILSLDISEQKKFKEQFRELQRVVAGRQQAEEALRESDQRIRQKLDSILSPEGDIGDLELADIIDVQAIQSLLDDFHELTHFPVSIIDIQGKLLAGVGWQEVCTNFHRVHPETCKHCLESDTQLSEGVPQGEFRLYKCKNNMWDIATPIVVGGKKLGNLFSGQFFFEGEPLDYDIFRSQAEQYGFNEAEYLAALERVPRLSRESVDSGMAFLVKLAQMLSVLSYGNIKLARSLAERDALMQALRVSLRFLEIVHLHQDFDSLLKDFVSEIKDYTGCEAVGIRVLDAAGGIPYQAYAGFSRQFFELESPLSINVDRCMCINVIKGDCDPRLPFYTAGGSFYINGTSRFLATVSEEDKGRTRNVCNLEGYETVALIPIRQGDRTLGLIHVADRREDMAPLELVEMLEKAAMQLGTAFLKLEAEKALRSSESHYRSLFDNMLNGFAYCRMIFEENQPKDFVLLEVNRAFEDLTGLKDAAGKRVSEVIPGIRDSEPEMFEIYGRVALTGISERFELHAKDLKKWFSVAAYCPQPGYFVAIFEVITERKQAQEALQESEARFRSLFDNMTEGVALHEIIYDEDGRAVDYRMVSNNPAFEKHTGLKPEQVCGQLASTAYGSGDAPYLEIFARVARTGQPHAFETYFPPLQRHFRVSATSPKQGQFVAVFEDITESKQMEAALRQSEEKYRLLVKQIPAVVFQGYGDWSVDFFDNKAEALCGYPKEEFDSRQRKWCDLILPEDLDKAQHIFTAALKNDKSYQREYRIRGKNGSIVWILDRGQIFYDAAGKMVHVSGVLFDITERKAAEEALWNHLNFMRTLIDTIPSPIFYKDTKGVYLGCNQAFSDFLGLPKEEIIGKSVYDLSPKELADRYMEMDAALFREPGVQRYDFSVMHADGTRHEVVFHKATYSTADSKLAGLVGVMIDITERKRVEDAVAAERQRFYSLLEAIPAYLGLLTPDYQVAFANRYFREQFGEPEGRRCYEYLFGRSEPCENCRAYKVLETKRPEEYEWLGPDGRTYQICDQLVHDTDGSPLILEMGIDITERKRMEDILKLNEARLEALLKLNQMAGAPLREISSFALEEAIQLTGSKIGYLAFVNEDETVLTMHAWSKNTMAECGIADKPLVYPLETTGLWGEAVRQRQAVITNDYSAPNPWKKGCPEGHVQVMKHMNAPIFDGNKIVIVAGVGNKPADYDESDVRQLTLLMEGMWRIIQRNRAEEARRESEQFLADIFDSIQDGLSILDPDLNIIRVNPAMEKFGYAQPMVGRKCYEVYHDQSSACESCPTKRTLVTGNPSREIVTGHLADGYERFVEILTHPMKDRASGQIKAVVEYVRDITEVRRAEAALEEEAIRRRLLFEQSRDGIVVLDQNGKVYEANQQYADMLGYSLEEVRQLHVWDWDARWSREELLKIIRLSDAAGGRFETVHHRKDGTTFDVEIVSNKVTLAGQKLEFCVCRDISQRKQAEEERLRFSKLESLATLAGGLAHDFNNILTAVLGNIGLAMLQLPDEGRTRERLTDAERACLQAQTLARQLLTFAKGGMPVKETVSVEKLITESASFTSRGSQVRCEVAFPEALWAIDADPGQINQVFQNLVINAIQAMPNGGTIKIRGENLKVSEGMELPLAHGRYVKISVEDQGVGMPEEYLPKIFDPYFTTKQKGSGLGLATAYSIVKNHHGHIAVESKLGVGTVFQVYLPACDKELIPAPAEDGDLPAGNGKVLVMDDDESVRHVLGKMLDFLGYEAQLARDGKEAIERFIGAKESGGAFDAVILDLTVPGGMGGKDVIENLLKIDPAVKSIVSSGYSEDPIMAEYEKYGFSGIIVKPYKVSDLGKVLHKVLETEAPE